MLAPLSSLCFLVFCIFSLKEIYPDADIFGALETFALFVFFFFFSELMLEVPNLPRIAYSNQPGDYHTLFLFSSVYSSKCWYIERTDYIRKLEIVIDSHRHGNICSLFQLSITSASLVFFLQVSYLVFAMLAWNSLCSAQFSHSLLLLLSGLKPPSF